jgi:hypothetical protein
MSNVKRANTLYDPALKVIVFAANRNYHPGEKRSLAPAARLPSSPNGSAIFADLLRGGRESFGLIKRQIAWKEGAK